MNIKNTILKNEADNQIETCYLRLQHSFHLIMYTILLKQEDRQD